MSVPWSILASVALVSALAKPLRAGSDEEYQCQIKPLLEKYCYECHGQEKHKAGLNLASFVEYEQVTGAPDTWQLVLEKVQAFEMPPKGKPDLDFDEHGKITKWLRELPQPEHVDCDQVASDRNTGSYRGYVMSRRLNRAEYRNTIRDLVGVDVSAEQSLPADGGGGEGFDTSGSTLFTSSIHIEKYLAAAQDVLGKVLTESVPTSSDEKLARNRLLIAEPSASIAAVDAARKIITTFVHRAFRRPVTEEETEALLTLFDRGWQRGDSFVSAIRLALKAVLISPHFLFLTEPEPSQAGVQPLAALPLASKLSYFLWSSMPDDQLLALAESGQLLDEQVYRGQVRRMLADPKAQALSERFALQWLDLERLVTDVHPDPGKFPEYDAELGLAMRQEVTEFFNDLFRNDRSLLNLIDSDYTFVNQRLAELYGIDEVSGPSFHRVKLTHHTRGGVTGMAAVAALTSYPRRTSPVLRGRWVMEVLLGEKVPPPPPDVPALEENAAHGEALTMRAQLEAHRAKTECAGCHSKMDPLGFSLENFDVLGRWRDSDRGQALDVQGILPSGEKFAGPSGLRDILLQRKDEVMKHLVRKMTGYAFGRELNRFDQCVVDRTLAALKANDYHASILIEQIAVSFPFRHRFYPKQSS